MKELAPGVWQLRGFPPNAINVYVIDDVLIDAAAPGTRRRAHPASSSRAVRSNAHALTHAHPDHQGASHEVCEKLGIPSTVPPPRATWRRPRTRS